MKPNLNEHVQLKWHGHGLSMENYICAKIFMKNKQDGDDTKTEGRKINDVTKDRGEDSPYLKFMIIIGPVQEDDY